MLQISIAELKAKTDKYVALADTQDIYITKNGKRIAKITSMQPDKVAVAQSLFGIISSDADLVSTRKEKLI